MKARGFTTLFAKLGLLSRLQRLQVLDALRPAAGLEQVVALIDQIRAGERCCPRCASPNWHRHGHANDLQRFRCRDCGRTYNDLSGTPLARLRLRGKWLDYLDTVLESKSVRKAASRIGVHRNTAFRWRHRFLEWGKLDRTPQFNGLVEADELSCSNRKKGRASSTGRRAVGVGLQHGAGYHGNTTASWSRAIAVGTRWTLSQAVAP